MGRIALTPGRPRNHGVLEMDVVTTAGRRTGDRHGTLAAVRTAHSAVFLVELWAISWLLATGVLGRGGRSVKVAAMLVAGESAVFVVNRGVCPLTPLAERYGAEHGGVSDIFLPGPVARSIPYWSTPLVVAGFALHAGRYARGRCRLRRPRPI